jgi:hypothetical protein
VSRQDRVLLPRLSQGESAPMLRVLDEHGGNVNLAEVQLLKFDSTMS